MICFLAILLLSWSFARILYHTLKSASGNALPLYHKTQALPTWRPMWFLVGSTSNLACHRDFHFAFPIPPSFFCVLGQLAIVYTGDTFIGVHFRSVSQNCVISKNKTKKTVCCYCDKKCSLHKPFEATSPKNRTVFIAPPSYPIVFLCAWKYIAISKFWVGYVVSFVGLAIFSGLRHD